MFKNKEEKSEWWELSERDNVTGGVIRMHSWGWVSGSLVDIRRAWVLFEVHWEANGGVKAGKGI